LSGQKFLIKYLAMFSVAIIAIILGALLVFNALFIAFVVPRGGVF